MIKQTGRCQSARTASYLAARSLIILRPILLLALALLLTACGPASSSLEGPLVRTALPTPTFEPTFTPSPPPSTTSKPSPTPTRAELTPTPTPQSVLSGRILDQVTNQPVARAKVSVGSVTVTTDAEGRYTLAGLPPGQYALFVTHEDYDPGLSSIFTLAAGQEQSLDLALYAPDASPYPKDPMLTNPLDPNGAPTPKDAERLARLQGLTGEVVGIREAKLSGEYLVNYKIGDEVRAAIAELNHEVWELTDDADRKWCIIKVCGNLASSLPAEVAVATPQPRPLLPLAEVMVDGLIVRECASETCAEFGTVQRGTRVEVVGCLADGAWCQVGLPGGGSGWCMGRSLKQLAVAQAVLVEEGVPPTPTPMSATFPSIDSLVGMWRNVDPNTHSWSRIEITREGNILFAHFWGACTPTECDAGVTSATYKGSPVRMYIDHGFATRDYTLSLEGDILYVTTFTHFTDNSGRADYTSEDYFRLQE